MAKIAIPDPKIVNIFEKMVVYPGESDDKDKIRARIHQIKKALRKAESIDEDRLLPFEKKQIENGAATLNLRKELKHFEMKLRGFAELDPVALSLTKADKLPAFFLVDISNEDDGPDFKIEVRPDGDAEGQYYMEISPDLPEFISSQFLSVTEYLDSIAKNKRWESISISTNLVGFIPDKIRKHLNKLQDIFDGVFILAEAKNWDLRRETTNRGDPIGIGVDSDTQQIFILNQFDLTSFEQELITSYTI